MKKEFTKTSLALEKSEYLLFKEICKKRDSDASKEIRKFIKSYNKKNSDLLGKNIKKNIKIKMELNEEDFENSSKFENIFISVINKYKINLELDKNKSIDDKSRILYSSKAVNPEYISEFYLIFLDEFLDSLQKIEDKYKIIHLPFN